MKRLLAWLRSHAVELFFAAFMVFLFASPSDLNRWEDVGDECYHHVTQEDGWFWWGEGPITRTLYCPDGRMR